MARAAIAAYEEAKVRADALSDLARADAELL
jgi:hypothetical protein